MAASTPILDSLYPTFELNPAVRRTAQAGATPGVGLQLCEARFRPRWLRPAPLKLPYWGRTTYSFLTKWAGRPGGTTTIDARAACCGPPVGRRPARATLQVAEAVPCSPPQFCQIRAARSGGGPNDPARRPGDPKGSQVFSLTHHPTHRPFITTFCRVRPVAHPPEALRAWATRPATQRVARARPLCDEVRPRRAPHAPLMRRSRRGRRFLWNRAIRS